MTDSLELVSIHINKTAGSSFESILRNNYDMVFRINTENSIATHRGHSCHGLELSQNIPTKAQVIHGHFTAKQVLPFFNPGMAIIAWVRDPVDRVISNYFYEYQSGKFDGGLLEYAELSQNRNKMSEMLDGIPWTHYFFLGVMEFFESEVEYLGSRLGWSVPEIPCLNVTEHNEVYQEGRDAIELLNQQDRRLYDTALYLRENP